VSLKIGDLVYVKQLRQRGKTDFGLVEVKYVAGRKEEFVCIAIGVQKAGEVFQSAKVVEGLEKLGWMPTPELKKRLDALSRPEPLAEPMAAAEEQRGEVAGG
jgi:hypothetical protein